MAVSVIDNVLTTISRYNMLRAGSRVIPAVSGGADSVFLLLALREIAPRFGASVSAVAHLNHQLRGAESDRDEQFVAALAARYGLPFYRAEARLLESRGNLEQAARRARLKFFEELLRQGEGDRIATGHTRDDQAETVLFRMLRGSGLAGLSGILPVTDSGLIRPLLETPRARIEEFLRDQGVDWREDSSNRDPRFARNRIRSVLLPQLEREWNPELRQALARTADLAAEEERWWSGPIAKLVRENAIESDAAVEFPVGPLARLPKAVARRLVRHLIVAAGGSNDFNRAEKILHLASSPRGSGRLELPGVIVTRSFDWLRFEKTCFQPAHPRSAPASVRLELHPGFRARIPWTGGWICLEVAEAGTEAPDSPGKTTRSACVRLKWKGLESSAFLELRGWRPGDHYRPCGSKRDQKLKEMFQTARVPSWKRDFWPIVTNGSKILWARQFGPAAQGRAPRAGAAWLWIWEEPQKDLGTPAGREESVERSRGMNHLPSIQRL